LLGNPADPAIKMFTTMRGLALRKTHADVFEKGDYITLRVSGAYARNIVAFARTYRKEWIIAVAPRLLTSVVKYGQLPLGTIWKNTQIEIRRHNFPPSFTNIFTEQTFATGGRINLEQILAGFPIALLYGKI
jgi:(1->4)-alpha-D-glucan 1-alpha-D-glucosylmutase